MIFMRPISFLHAYKYIALLAVLVFMAAASPLQAQWVPLNPVNSVDQQPDGVVLVLQTGFLRFQVCSDSIVHVVYSIERDVPQRPDNLVIKKSWPKADFALHTDDPKLITLTTSRLKSKSPAPTARSSSTTPPVTNSPKKTPARSRQPKSTARKPTTPSVSSTCGTHRKPSTASASIRPASGTIAANPSTSRKTTRTSPFHFFSPATATASSGTTARAANSRIASSTPST